MTGLPVAEVSNAIAEWEASGAIRRYAYERFSEGRAAHWLLLIAGEWCDGPEHRDVVLGAHDDQKRMGVPRIGSDALRRRVR